MKNSIFLLIILFSTSSYAQSRESGDCIYRTIEDFAEKNCDHSEKPYVDKVLAKKKSVKKYLIKTTKKNKRLKEAFAVVINGELYYQQYVVSRYLKKGDRLPQANSNTDFIKVKSQGLYDYMEWSERGNNGSGLGIGSGTFGTGIGLGTSINFGKKKVTGLIYDAERFEFNSFKNCKDFNAFLAERHPSLAYDCKKKKLDIETVRNVMAKINKGMSRSLNAVGENTTDGESMRYVTVYPHRTIVRNKCKLTIGEEIVEFNDLSVLDIDLDCGGNNMICIEGTEICLDVPCDSKIEYVIISRDRESREYAIEISNEKEFKYYNALIERRRKRRK